MIKVIGSQSREKIEDTEYIVDYMDDIDDVPRDVFLLDMETGVREKWTENDHYAGYVVEIDGVGFEFVCSL